jgi:hypothetical protein
MIHLSADSGATTPINAMAALAPPVTTLNRNVIRNNHLKARPQAFFDAPEQKEGIWKGLRYELQRTDGPRSGCEPIRRAHAKQ